MDTADDDVGKGSNIPGTQTVSSNEEKTSATVIPKLSSEGAQSVQTIAQSLTDQTLNFISTASNETIGACLVGLGATTYFVLGRVGLVLIGIVGGIALHASWEGAYEPQQYQAVKAAEEKRRRDIGLDVIHRVWNRRINTKAVYEEDGQKDFRDVVVAPPAGIKLDFSSFPPDTSAALTELTDAVVRDYVKWWYSPILPEEVSFPSSCRHTMTAFVLSVANRVSRLRPADAFLDFLTNSSLITTVFLNELAAALSASPNTAAAEAIETYLQTKPESNLASLLDTRNQRRKLDLVADDILGCFLDTKIYECDPARVFLCQVLAKMIMEPTITTCSQPEWINAWIVYLLEETEPELLSAIDTDTEGTNSIKDVSGGTAASAGDSSTKASAANHKRVVSKAQEAMDDAMREAKRLSALMAEEDARLAREQEALDRASIDVLSLGTLSPTLPSRRGSEKSERSPPPPEKPTASPDISAHVSDDASEVTTQGMATPSSSSQGDHQDLMHPSPHTLSVDQFPVNPEESANGTPKMNFTNFDQLVPVQQPTALGISTEIAKKDIPPLTLFNAAITILDDSMPGEKAIIRAKPVTEYVIQVEPASQHHSGWMIAHKYVDFENLHEVLRKLSAISGAGFSEAHSTLPNWKGHTKPSIRGELERYLNDAVHWQSLAESDAMKRFFDKDNNLGRSQNKGFPGLGWANPSAFENVGKGMIDVLSKAPKEVAGGGKAIFGGVTGVLGGIGQKKANVSSTSVNRSSTSLSSPSPAKPTLESSARSPPGARQSQDTLRTTSPVVDTQPPRIPPMERRPSFEPDSDSGSRHPTSSVASLPKSSRNSSRANSVRESVQMEPMQEVEQLMHLPPPPSEIADDFGTASTARLNLAEENKRLSRASTLANPTGSEPQTERSSEEAPSKTSSQFSASKRPLTEQDTQTTVELFFAIISELYMLSSAWGLRRTLLTAAKNFLLRPGNPQLESIRQLLQTSVLDANASDSGIAAHIRKLRENSLPTEEELKAWPAPLNDKEKEELRRKARKLLVEKGMPQALTTVMGAAASGEALGKVFDCLQVGLVSRGLMFGLMLQGIRIVTQS